MPDPNNAKNTPGPTRLKITVMFQGKVVEQGLKSEILNPPYPDYTQLLLSSVPEMDPDWLSNLVDNRS